MEMRRPDLSMPTLAPALGIFGMQGLVRDITGHVSARIPGAQEMFIRCRGGDERGLAYTDVEQLRPAAAGRRRGPQDLDAL